MIQRTINHIGFYLFSAIQFTLIYLLLAVMLVFDIVDAIRVRCDKNRAKDGK